ncbi:MAG: glmS [Rickettsiaceae bacterium]|jgi:glucosamine--fructose-6-phosphate aminotransferase (isomerizing)|nr:glmS [Rickettsiaceae bacterium]
MCGIIGIIGKKEVSPLLIEGLRRLEYRGYDSSGIATLSEGKINCSRAAGKLKSLELELEKKPLSGTLGIGHTRWATHGMPSTNNAHPHITDKVGVIHNGIIENFIELREELEGYGYKFKTETDTEVIPILITHLLDQGKTPHEAVSATLKKLEGAFALGIIFAGNDDLLVAARRGSPLAIGYGDGEMYIASDAYALAPLTSKITYLKDGDWAEITRTSVAIYDSEDKKVEREIKPTNLSGAATGKGNYAHFMLKEIYEQPGVIGETLNSFYNPVTASIQLPEFSFDLEKISRVTIIACGTSYYAGMVAKYWFENIAKIPTEVDIASEFRYSNKLLPQDGLALFISQSGETADTMAALKYAKEHKQNIVSIINAQESSMERESDMVLHTLAGPEIGVASTKAFTTQLVALACLAITMADARGAISKDEIAKLSYALSEVPSRAVEVLNHDENLKELARDLSKARDVIYIGRGTAYPLAMEGALKLKEISYIHAEGVAAGELKHGPIALIDESVPVIVIAPYDNLFDKTASNVQEVAARGGRVIFLSDNDGIKRLKKISSETIELPKVNPFVAPILYAIPIQLLAYHTAVIKGTDVDQPRNLAKSVTVE